MNIKTLHTNFRMPTKGTDGAGAYDLYMPEEGCVYKDEPEGVMVGLGFSAAVPKGHVALLLPRSGAGAKFGVALNNTAGIVDSDYRGEWKVSIRLHNDAPFKWNAGDRLFQMLIVPVADVTLNQVEELDTTSRGEGGFGSSGK
jgi:dUTP pyrophosphatase